MLMHKELAESLVKGLLSCSGMLDQSAAEVQVSADQDFFYQYRSSVGQMMGSFYYDILRKIFLQYPELEPDSFKK
jgi:hypothetical protein